MNKIMSALSGLAILALMYSCVGVLIGIVYTFLISPLGLPQIGIFALLGVWWAWFLVFFPPIVFYISVLRATDPLARAVEDLSIPKK